MAEKNKRKKSNKKVHGRTVSGGKVALIVVGFILAIILALLIVFGPQIKGIVDVLMDNYRPSVDNDAHFATPPNHQSLTTKYTTGMEKYHFIKELRALGKYRDDFMETAGMKPLNRVDGVYNFLVLGRDKVALNTDVIMVMNFNTKTGSINLMQLPRDTYIEFGGYPNKINGTLAHFYTKALRDGTKDPWHTALKDFSDLLEVAFSIEIDYYAIIDLAAFENVVDIIGGVPIDVPEDMDYDDPYQNLSIHIKKGPQVLDGETAADFVRFRSGYVQADIGRQNAQKLFMTALFKQVKASFSVDTVSKLVTEVLSKVSTNMEFTDAVYFAKEALSIDLGNISMMTIPGEAITTHLSYYVIYRESVLDVVNKYFNVYDGDVHTLLFDREALFTDSDDKALDAIYNKTVDNYVVNNGESIDSSGIYIPRLPDAPKEEEPSEDTSEVTISDVSQSEDTDYEDEYATDEVSDSVESDTESVDSESTEDETDAVTDEAFDSTESDTETVDETEDSEAFDETISEAVTEESSDTEADTYID